MSEHAVREQRLAGIRDAVEEFTYSLALLIAGHDAPGDAPNHDLIVLLQRELRPFLDAGDAMRPDFGSFGDLRIEGALLQPAEHALVTLEFDDRCARETVHGRVIPARMRRLRVTMHVAVDPVRIVDCGICEIGGRRG
ncbi:MAG: hypothetical protein ACYDCS_13340 [Candidatus Dormibacteria bacterium]